MKKTAQIGTVVLLSLFAASCVCGPCGGGRARKCGPCGPGGACPTGKCAAKLAPAAEVEPEINTLGLKVLLDSGTPVTILDARSGKYDDGRRIPGAATLAADATEAAAAKLINNKDALVVTYCSNLKCPASRMLAGQLRKLGYKHVIEYPHGIDGWAEAGYEIETAKK
jgi:rhodanese-related sulfurtransferase